MCASRSSFVLQIHFLSGQACVSLFKTIDYHIQKITCHCQATQFNTYDWSEESYRCSPEITDRQICHSYYLFLHYCSHLKEIFITHLTYFSSIRNWWLKIWMSWFRWGATLISQRKWSILKRGWQVRTWERNLGEDTRKKSRGRKKRKGKTFRWRQWDWRRAGGGYSTKCRRMIV